MQIKLTSYLGIAIIYGIFIIGALVYFVALQHFGYYGSVFRMGGHDSIVSPLDVVLIITFIISTILLIIALVAFGRKKTIRMFVISLTFFFFTVKEFLIMLENFFPGENIYIGNATGALELLILLSFVLLIYNIYKPK